MFEIGRICMKTAGREAGKYCVVIAKEKDKEFLLITGPKAATHVRRRKCNYRHLEATPYKIEIAENASDEDVMKAYEKEDILTKLRIVPLTEEQMRLSAERAAKHKADKAAAAEHKHTEAKEHAHKTEHEHKEAKHEHKEHKAEHKHEHKEEKAKKPRASKKKKEA